MILFGLRERCAALAVVLLGCHGQQEAGSGRIAGSAQKGPMVAGSQIIASSLAADGTPTGQSYPSETTDDQGSFALVAPKGLMLLQAQGFYYNEASGQLSAAPISLRSLRVDPEQETQFVNLLTHLAYERATSLLSVSAPNDALAQAEAELEAALAIGPKNLQLSAPAAAMNVLGPSTVDNAYLLAVSMVFAEAARAAAGASGSIDGNLQLIVNQAALGLAAGGKLDAALVAQLAAAESALLPEIAQPALLAYLAKIGSKATPPDPNIALDTDHDGVANAVDNCRWIANPAQQPIKDGVCYASATRLGDGLPFGVSGVVTADWDGDGHLDALVAEDGNKSAGKIHFLRGDGHGGLAEKAVLAEGGLQLVADVNGDGKADLVTQPDFTGLHVWLGDGTFKLSASPIAAAPTDQFGLVRMLAGELDGDKKVDLVTLQDAGGAPGDKMPVHALLGDGAGHFSHLASNVTIPAGPAIQVDRATALADVDGDGALDLLAAGMENGGHAVIAVFLGAGDGSFKSLVTRTLSLPLGGGKMSLTPLAAAGDVDGDGKLDLVLASGAQVATVFGNGTAAFGVETSAIIGVPVGPFVALADVTGDGKLDLVANRYGDIGPTMLFAPGNGKGSFGPITTRPWALAGSPAAMYFATGDLDENGTQDLVAGGAGQPSPALAVELLLNP